MTAMFKKLHGATLAKNSWVENFHVETLAADPTELDLPGRVWYNSTTRFFKWTELNEVGAVVVKTAATVEALTAGLAQLDTDLRAHVASEIAGLQGQVSGLGNAFNYVGKLPARTGVTGTGTDVDPYILDGMEAGYTDAGDYYKIETAGYYKLGSEAAIQFELNDGLVFNTAGGLDRINNQQSSVGGTTDEVDVGGSVETGFTVSLAQAVKDAISDNATAISTESARAKAVEGTLANLNTTAKGNLVSAINEVVSSVAQEAAARASAVTAVDNKVGDLSGLQTTEKGSVAGAVNELVTSIQELGGTVAAAGGRQLAVFDDNDAMTQWLTDHNNGTTPIVANVGDYVITNFSGSVYAAGDTRLRPNVGDRWYFNAEIASGAIPTGLEYYIIGEKTDNEVQAIIDSGDTGEDDVFIITTGGIITLSEGNDLAVSPGDWLRITAYTGPGDVNGVIFDPAGDITANSLTLTHASRFGELDLILEERDYMPEGGRMFAAFGSAVDATDYFNDFEDEQFFKTTLFDGDYFIAGFDGTITFSHEVEEGVQDSLDVKVGDVWHVNTQVEAQSGVSTLRSTYFTLNQQSRLNEIIADLALEVQNRGAHVQSAIDFTQSVSDALGNEINTRQEDDQALGLQISQEATARSNGDATLQSIIDELAALAGITGELGGAGGDLNDLTTTAKGSLVAAINELAASGGFSERLSVTYAGTADTTVAALIEGADFRGNALVVGDTIAVVTDTADSGFGRIYTVTAGGSAPTLTKTIAAPTLVEVLKGAKSGSSGSRKLHAAGIFYVNPALGQSFRLTYTDSAWMSHGDTTLAVALSSLSNAQGDLSSLNTTDQTSLVAAINESIEDSSALVAGLAGAIDSSVAIYDSMEEGGAATSHVFTHGLTGDYLSVEVQFREDVPQTFTDLGAMTVADANALISGGTLNAGEKFTVVDSGNLLLGPTAVVSSDVVYVTAYSYNEGSYTGTVTTTEPTRVIWVNDSAAVHTDPDAGTVTVYTSNDEDVRIFVKDLSPLLAP